MVINWTRLLGAPRVVIHSTDPGLAELVRQSFGDRAIEVRHEPGVHRRDGPTGPHLAVVDLASHRAIETLREYTQGAAAVPTMVIVRSAELASSLAAFANGADDVVTLAVAPTELAARVGAVLRRSYGRRVSFVAAVRVGDLEIDVMQNHVRCGASEPALTSTEQAILFVLATNVGRTVSRDAIRAAVWGTDSAPASNIVDRHVRALRLKLGDSWRAPRYIATVRQHGYRLVAA